MQIGKVVGTVVAMYTPMQRSLNVVGIDSSRVDMDRLDRHVAGHDDSHHAAARAVFEKWELDFATVGVSSAFVAGDSIDGVLISGGVNNTAFVSGVISLGADGRLGGHFRLIDGCRDVAIEQAPCESRGFLHLHTAARGRGGADGARALINSRPCAAARAWPRPRRPRARSPAAAGSRPRSPRRTAATPHCPDRA
mgnify:CR=1 FL=1